MLTKQEKLWLCLLLTAAAAVRGFLIFRDLEYDEIWSLENYAALPLSKIFSDLSTPNNHPVNTLLIKFLWFSKEFFWSIRIGSLLFSTASVALLWLIGRKLFSRSAAWYAAVAGAFLPPLIVSGTTARGYAGEMFYLLLFHLALLNCRKGSIKWCITAAISALFAIISLPTAVLYMVPTAGFYLLYFWKKRRFFPLQTAIFSTAALLAGFWFIINFNSFIQQKQFKASFTSFEGFYSWLNSAFSENGIWMWILPLIIIIFRKRKIIWVLAAMFLFPLLAALVTSPAPARVYLPSAAVGILLCASFSTIKKWRYGMSAALLLMQTAVSYPERSEEKTVQKIYNLSAPDGHIKIYPPAAGYPLRWNHPETVEKFFLSLISASQKDICFLALPEKENISGFAMDGSVISAPLPFKLTASDKDAPYLLALKKSSIIPPDTLAFAIYPPMPQENLTALFQDLAPKTTLFFNQWFRVPLKAPDGKIHKYMIFAFTLDRERRFPAGYPYYLPLEK